MSLGLIMCISH